MAERHFLGHPRAAIGEKLILNCGIVKMNIVSSSLAIM